VPIYEFNCEACGAEFERIQSFSDETIPQCPSCASGQVRRRMGRPAIHFKGSGWYITDSKKASGGSKSSNGGSAVSSEKTATSDAAATNGAGEKSSEKKTETVTTAAAPAE
jgi:putative FmdB family regulatory protein